MKLRQYTLIGFLLTVILGTVFLLKGYFPWNNSGCSQEIGETVFILNDDSFTPASTTISRCTKVVFQIEGVNPHWPAADLHPTHGTYPEFDSEKPINPGETWSFVFDKVGKWKCHDHLNPKVRCVITVVE